MSIPTAAIKFFASQEMDDTDEGGGVMSGVQITDNVVGNIFPKLSPLDRVYGRIKIRKIFPAIDTTNTDTYSGGHVIVSQGPADPRVSVTLFSTGNYDDHRIDHENYIESYVIGGPLTDFRLYGDQLPGQRSILVFGRSDGTLPQVGDVLLLSTEQVGQPANQQYVRVSAMDSITKSFTTQASGTFQALQATIGISSPLRFKFLGMQVTAYSDIQPSTVLRNTIPADTARYYGTTTLALPASTGDLNITLGSIFTQLVPSTTVESPVANAQAGGIAATVVPSGAPLTFLLSSVIPVPDPYSFGWPSFFEPPQKIFTSHGIAPKSITWPFGAVFNDDGQGNLVASTTGATMATIDYVGGVLTARTQYTWGQGQANTFTFTPGAAVSAVADTDDLPITQLNRGFNYVLNLVPIPAPGTTVISYKAQGLWYDLKDLGSGVLQGSSEAFGTGTIDFATGDVIVTLGALPDVGTSLLQAWGTPVHYHIRTGDLTIAPPQVVGTVQHGGVAPSSVEFTWQVGGVTKTATDNGSGHLTGDGTGTFNYTTGAYALQQGAIQDAATPINVAYDSGGNLNFQATPTPDPTTLNISFVLPSAPIAAGSVSIILHGDVADYSQKNRIALTVVDDGVGGLIRTDTGAALAGSVNYATGAVAMPTAIPFSAHQYNLPFYSFSVSGGGGGGGSALYVGNPSAPAGTWQLGEVGWNYEVTTGINATYAQPPSGAPTSFTEAINTPALTILLTPGTLEAVVPGSVEFVFAKHRYVDRNGDVYRDIDPNNNSGTLAGSIDYTSGIVRLTNYVAGPNTISVKALLTQYGLPTLWQLRFRAPGAPLRSGSLFIRAVKSRDGGQITGTSDPDGNLVSTDMRGTVDYQNGIVRVDFGRLVLDASLTADDKAEWWYNTDNVDGTGHIFRPHEVLPDTVKYNCVVFSSVPVDADLLGLDPVRLPQDGRVPMVRPGDVLVVMNTHKQTLPNPVVLAHPYATRANIASVAVRDAIGTLVDDTLYTVDLDTGDFQFNLAADLSTYTQPFELADRIEDMVRTGDVQINGSVQLAGALSHDYTAGDTLVASALLIGDVQSRAYNLFTQQTWLNVWQDSASGNGTNGQYNIAQYPIQVQNKGAIKQRWRIQFTNTTNFAVIGETRGQIATGTIGADLAPINPATGTPYFVILAAGWSNGWAAGNVVRWNTDGANYPIELAQTVLSGPKTANDDEATIEFRGAA